VVFARQQDRQTTLHATERQSHSVTRLSNSTERQTLITISNSLRHLGRIFVNKNNHHESRREVREQLLSVRNGLNQNIFRSFINAALLGRGPRIFKGYNTYSQDIGSAGYIARNIARSNVVARDEYDAYANSRLRMRCARDLL